MFPHSSRGQNYCTICNKEQAAPAEALPASSTPQALSLAPHGWGHSPSLPISNRHRALMPRLFPAGYCTHCCALARRGIRVSVVVSFLLPLSRPSNRDFKEPCNSMVIAQDSLQDAVFLLHSSFLHYNEILLLVSSAPNEGGMRPSMCTYPGFLCHSQWLHLELFSFS